MSIFKKIFNFKKKEVEYFIQRKEKRYDVGSDYPIKGLVSYKGDSKEETEVLNLSNSGLRLHVPDKPSIQISSLIDLFIAIKDNKIPLNAKLTNLVDSGSSYQMGFETTLATLEDRKRYMQAMTPVIIGNTLRPVADKFVNQDEAGLYKIIFNGEKKSRLIIWQDNHSKSKEISSFEFDLEEFIVRGSDSGKRMDILFPDKDDRINRIKGSTMLYKDEEREAEVLEFFNWVLYNIKDNVPLEVQDYFRTLFKA